MNGGEIFVKDKIFVEVGSGGQFLPLINFSTFWALLHLPELPLLPHYWFVLIHLAPSPRYHLSTAQRTRKLYFFQMRTPTKHVFPNCSALSVWIMASATCTNDVLSIERLPAAFTTVTVPYWAGSKHQYREMTVSDPRRVPLLSQGTLE